MAEDLTLGIKVQADGIKSTTKELDALATAGAKAETNTEKVGKAAKGTVAPMKNMRAQAQQASYQFQDIAVQAQMGTSWFTIIGQQGSQLASVFGPSGAITGALIAFGAILGGVVYKSINSTGEAMEELEETMDNLVDKFDDLTAAQKAFVRVGVEEKISNNNDLLRKAQQEMNSLNSITLSFNQIFFGKSAEEKKARIIEVTATIDSLKQTNKILTASIDDTTNSTEDLIKKLTEEANVLGLTGVQLAEYKAKQSKANEEDTKTILLLADKIEKYKKNEEQIKRVAKENKEFLASELALQKFFDGENAKKDKKDESEAKKLELQKASAEARLLQITQSAMDESALLDSILNENATKLAEDYANKLINEEQFLIGMKALNEKYSKDGVALATAEAQAKTDIQQQVISSMSGIAGQLSGIAAEGSKEAKVLFAMQKALAIAQIIVSTEVAAQAAGAQAAILTGPLGYFATAAGIRAVGYASAGIVAGTAIAGGRALGGQVRGGESYLVGERGPELLTMGSSGRIATNENLKKAVGSESGQSQANVSVNFSIQANDTAGFDRLLNSRRGQIVSMINHAVNNRGRASIT